MITAELITALVTRCRHHGAAMVALFGSTVRQEDTAKSDIDLLVRFHSPKSLIAFSGIERELSEIANRPVDLVTENSLSPHFRDKVFSEMKLLYGTR
jgi:predicted nucleotidyltransferase